MLRMLWFLVFFLLEISLCVVTLSNHIPDQFVEPNDKFNFTIPLRTFSTSDRSRVQFTFNNSEPSWTSVVSLGKHVAGQTLNYDASGTNIFTSGTLSYITGGTAGLFIFDTSDPDNPDYKSRIHDIGETMDVYVVEDYAYVVTSTELVIVDVSDLENPEVISEVSISGAARCIHILDDVYAYITVDLPSNALLIYDVSDPLNPYEASTYNLPTGYGLTCEGEFCYICCQTSGLKIFNASVRTAPSHVGEYLDGTRECRSVVVDGDYAYLAHSDFISVISISDKATPTFVADKEFINPCTTYDIIIDSGSNYAYVALTGDYDCGLGICDLSTLPTSVCDTPYYYKAYGSNDRKGKALTFKTGDENYVNFVDEDFGLVIIDVTTPTSPSQTKLFDFSHASAQRIIVNDNSTIAYVAMGGGGLYTFDITSDALTSPSLLSIVPAQFPLIGMKRFDISDDGRYIYLLDEDIGFLIVDISDPTHPELLSEVLITEGRDIVSDGQGWVFVAGGVEGLFVVNCTDPTDPSIVYTLVPVHSGAGGDDMDKMYIDKENDLNTVYVIAYHITGTEELLYVVDVTDRSSPSVIWEDGVENQLFYVYNDLCHFVVRGEWLYFCTCYNTLVRSVELTDSKKKPFDRSTYNLPSLNKGYHLTLQNDYLYVSSKSYGIHILDVSNPNSITDYELGVKVVEGDPIGTYMRKEFGNLLFVASQENGMGIMGLDGLRLTGVSPSNDMISEVHVVATNVDDNLDADEDWFLIKVTSTDFDCFGVLKNETGDICNGNGECVKMDTCHCDSNYYGIECNITTCGSFFTNDTLNRFCSMHGECDDFNTCQCELDYFGDICDVTQCRDGFLNNDTSNVCSSHGTCHVHLEECSCQPNYYGKECNVTTCFDSWSNDTLASICSDHGTCDIHDSCECQPDYFGGFCNVTVCFGVFSNSTDENVDVCHGHGKCDSKDVCRCEESYFGKYCNITQCNNVWNNDTTVCSNHGKCEIFEKCNCDPYYYGEDCNITMCFGQFSNDSENNGCNGKHGKCVDLDICRCMSTYYGGTCNVTKCHGIWSNKTSEVCSNGNGRCEDFDHCSCLFDYYGDTCNITTCFEDFSNETGIVCSSHGKCIDNDICHCSENYFGVKCSVTKCFGIWNNISSTTICTSHGNCEQTDHCICYDYYFGKLCNITTCNGYFNNITEDGYTPLYCNNHGECIEYETCKCENQFHGQECENELYICNGIYSNETSSVCSGNGECLKWGNCSCDKGFEKLELCGEVSICGEFMGNDTLNVCGGEGDCIWSVEDGNMYTCKCNQGYHHNGLFDCIQFIGGNDDGKDEEEDSTTGKPFIETTAGPIVIVAIAVVIMTVICMPLILICLCICLIFPIAIGGFSCCTCFGVGLLSFQKIFTKTGGVPIKMDKLERASSRQELKRLFAEIKIDASLFEIQYKNLRVVKEIGLGGGNAPIYHCKWKKKDVAFKCFQTRGIFGDKHMFHEFERESRVMSSLRHPNILDYYGSTLHPPRVGIVMEFCENGDLRRFLTYHSDYPLHQRFRILKESSEGLAYLHDRNVLHRDVKSENILLTSDYRAKIIDFGLSRIVSHMSTKKSTKIGTKMYMAPEVVLGESYDEKCDVFSFAIVMWEVIFLDFEPYKDDDLFNIEFRVANQHNKRPDLGGLPENLREGPFEEVMQKCWNHESKERYSFEELVDILRELEEKFGNETLVDNESSGDENSSSGDIGEEESQKSEESEDEESSKSDGEGSSDQEEINPKMSSTEEDSEEESDEEET